MSRRLHVLAEGDGWIAVAKPPHLLVHRSEQTQHASAALQIVRDQTGGHVYPIHRLDRSASGCLLFARDRTLAGPLSAAMTAGRKTYLAFVRGALMADGPIVVDTPMKDDNDILKDARSTVWCLGRSHEPRCSLLKVETETGRYHQVRRHVRDLHHPIIGDTDHGDTKVNRWWRENKGATRLGLHALSLSLPAGADTPAIDVTCPLFTDLSSVWSTLPWWEEAVAKEPALSLQTLGVRVRKPRLPRPPVAPVPDAV